MVKIATRTTIARDSTDERRLPIARSPCVLLEPERSEEQQPRGDRQAETDAEDAEESEGAAARSGSDQHDIEPSSITAKEIDTTPRLPQQQSPRCRP